MRWIAITFKRFIAAWHIVRADEFFVATKKHCKTYKSSLSGVELLDFVLEKGKNQLDRHENE